MKNTIRSLVLASAVLATAAFTVPTAMAATTLDVPFAFTVGNRTAPPATTWLTATEMALPSSLSAQLRASPGVSSRRSGSYRQSRGAQVRRHWIGPCAELDPVRRAHHFTARQKIASPGIWI